MIVISYGLDGVKITYDALAASDISDFLKPGMSIALKPNLVVPGPASNGAVTHPQVTEGVIRFLKDFGIKDIKIIESSWIGADTKKAFKHCDYEQLSKMYNIPLIDLKKDKYTRLRHSGLEIDVCNEALRTDFLINIPVLKAHCQTRLTCCLKNLKGCIPDSEKRRFHTLGIHKPVAALNALIKTGYCVVDGICGDLTFEEGGNPVTANRVIAGHDPVMVDSYCAALIGYAPDDIEYLTYARQAGAGCYITDDVKITVLGAANKPLHTDDINAAPASEKYRSFIDEDCACSACYSSLVFALSRMNLRHSDFAKLTGGSNKLHIGQGFKGKSGMGTGIGNCACGFDLCVKGCPPSAKDIIGILGGIV